MKKKNSIAIFLAATSALAITTTENHTLKAGENDLGGLKEWNTDMPLNADFVLDDEAQRLAMKPPLQVLVYLLEKAKIAGKNFIKCFIPIKE